MSIEFKVNEALHHYARFEKAMREAVEEMRFSFPVEYQIETAQGWSTCTARDYQTSSGPKRILVIVEQK